jgi:cell division protein FtsL
MDARSRHYEDFEYFEGNTVRKLSTVPDYNRERVERNQDNQRRQQVRRGASKREQTMGIDLVSLMFLTAAIIVTMYVCVEYLQVQSGITGMSKEIVSLENQVLDLKNENATTLEQVNASVDLAYVYEVATKQLGMVHAKNNQVITYNGVKSDYVRQYDDIPSSDKSDFFDYILKNQN